MKNYNKLEQFADSIMTICKVMYGCEEINVDIDMDMDGTGISIKVDLTPIQDDDEGGISEDDIDKECEKHTDCCGCPYENYCNSEEEDE